MTLRESVLKPSASLDGKGIKIDEIYTFTEKGELAKLTGIETLDMRVRVWKGNHPLSLTVYSGGFARFDMRSFRLGGKESRGHQVVVGIRGARNEVKQKPEEKPLKQQPKLYKQFNYNYYMGKVMQKTSNDVDKYIARAPKETQKKLREVRAAIRKVAPEAVESISYGMPFYSFKGETGFQARLCYFGLLKGRIAFYSRPLFIEDHMDEAARYMTSKSALQFPIDKPIPIPLIKKLVSNGIRKHSGVHP